MKKSAAKRPLPVASDRVVPRDQLASVIGGDGQKTGAITGQSMISANKD